MLNTWKKDFQYSKAMADRVGRLLSLVPLKNFQSLMDLGCGVQNAKKYIPQTMRYIPVDLHAHCPDTIICDFNQGQFPPHEVEIILCSGVIEYIHDLNWFIHKITAHSQVVIGSYNFSEYFSDRQDIWVNHLTVSELIAKFDKNGFSLEHFESGLQQKTAVYDSKFNKFDRDHYFVFVKRPVLINGN